MSGGPMNQLGNKALLSVRDLSVAFRQNGEERISVDRISFDIAEGETVALVGDRDRANPSRRYPSSSCCPIRPQAILPGKFFSTARTS